MGKPTGFLEFERLSETYEKPDDRKKHYREFVAVLDEAAAKQQGARCMDCGVPFCHTGTLISGMASGCPVNNLIPEWNDLVYRGLWREALERLNKTLKSRHKLVIDGGYGKLKGKTFRLSNMGDETDATIVGLLSALDRSLGNR